MEPASYKVRAIKSRKNAEPYILNRYTPGFIVNIENITVSFFSNLLFERYKKTWMVEDDALNLAALDDNQNLEYPETFLKPDKIRLYSLHYLDDIILITENPIIHIIIDTVPFGYFSIAVVVESLITSEWYVIESGELALQGVGGGYRRFEAFMELLKKHEISAFIWCSDGDTLSQLERGDIAWHQAKLELWPFLMRANSDQKGWEEVVLGVKKFFPELENLIDRNP